MKFKEPLGKEPLVNVSNVMTGNLEVLSNELPMAVLCNSN